MSDLINWLLQPFQFLIDLITLGYQYILDFIYQDIYQFFTKWTAEYIKAATIAEIETKIAVMSFSWDVAKEILISLNVSQSISQAWGMLDYRILQLLTFFRIPEGINLILTAYTTRFVYRFLGFGK